MASDKRDYEDRIDDAMWGFIRTCLEHSWDIADRTFKMAAWFVVFSTVLQLGRATQVAEVTWVGIALGALWFYAGLGLLMTVRDHFSNWREKRIEAVRGKSVWRALWTIFLSVSAGAVLALGVVYGSGILGRAVVAVIDYTLRRPV